MNKNADSSGGRKIFQPTELTSKLINGYCAATKNTVGDLVNAAIKEYYTPVNKKLRKETEFLFMKITKQEEIAPEALQACLARSVEILKDFPISDVRPLVQIFYHFTTSIPRKYRYDYIQIVDMMQDEILHRLNEILKTVDNDYNLGTREFGERFRYIYENWETLCRYSEIYKQMAVLIECEDIYNSLDVYRCLDLIIWLDKAVRDSDLTPIKEPFPTAITTTQRYHGIKYEILVYQGDNGYLHLSGDGDFKLTPEIREYYSRLARLNSPYGEPTEEDLQQAIAVEKEGRMLFRRLKNKKI